MASLPTPNSTASFWHSEPSEFLHGHRTTTELPADADIVIVGSGITGASAARFLTEDERAEGLSIVMLDAREACWGATGRNGGHCQPLLFDSSPDVAAFELRNYHNVKSYIEDNKVTCEWRSLTSCRTFWTRALAKTAAEDVQKLKHDAPALGEVVNLVDDEQELQKLRVNGAVCATMTATAGSLWPYKLIAFILEKVIREGKLNLQTNTPVTKLEPCKDSSGAVLHTNRGTIRGHHIILATNGYTSHLLPEFKDLIVPERGVMTALLPPKRSDRLDHSYGFVGAFGGNPLHDDYLVQRAFSGVSSPRGHLMFGGGYVGKTLNMIGETDDSVLDEGCAKYLRESLLKLLKLGGEADDMKELEATHQWSGIWGTSRDHHPWVGEVPDQPGVWLSGGYSGHGMPNATLCGKAVVEMIIGQTSSKNLQHIQETLVNNGDLPKAYVISKDRIERSRRLDSVEVQDRCGVPGIPFKPQESKLS
ncbi:hypothetical protein ACLMJK_002969 [Lecanora helva]